MAADELEYSDTLEKEGDAKSSARVLSAISKAEDAFRSYQDACRRIDEVYSLSPTYDSGWTDPEYDLFWSSMEILKPAIYAHPPAPAVSPQFQDTRPLQNKTAELLERVTSSAFDRTNIDEVMLEVRDDLALTNRGQMWGTYETDEKGGGQRACIEHLDRTDFLHEPARKWSEVGWVARRAWMTKAAMGKRFKKHSGDAYKNASTEVRREDKANGSADNSRKVGVWEVWHKNDNRVYWVAEGVPVILDEGDPHLKLEGFFPCPRPAYGTLRRRSLVPVPDYLRYEVHFNKINVLTARIYLLLDKVKLKVFIPAGGDIGNAIETALRSEDDELVIPVPAAALSTGQANLMVTLPLKEIAEAIQGLIASRSQLFDDFYQLSGISDIMRGATEAQETLGAQQLKTQYGSVRVKDKIHELQRIAADMSRIVAEIAAQKFDEKTLLDMSQMEIPSKRDVDKQIKALEDAAEKELEALGKKAQQAAMQAQQTGEQVDPAQAEQQFQQAQQQIIQKYAGQLKTLEETVPIEDVIKLLRDNRARNFAFEIATDSTILTDEVQEKASRNEFLTTFTTASTGLMGIAAMGEAGAALAGGLIKFVLAPFRVGRDLNTLVDNFIEAAPQLAAQMQQQGAPEGQAELIAAQNKLAEAELIKANAKVAETEAKAAQQGAEQQRKMLELQQKGAEDQRRFTAEIGNLRAKITETEAKVRNLDANTELTLSKVGIDAHKERREDVKTAADIQSRQVDQAMSAEDRQRQAVESDRSAAMGERQQSFTESQSDRQQTFAERQVERDRANGA